jgi:hypothetical protein
LIGEIYQPFQALRPMPNTIVTSNTGFRDHLELVCRAVAQDFSHGAAAATVALKNATVQESLLYIESESGFQTVYETHRPCDRHAVRWLDEMSVKDSRISLSDVGALDFFIGSAGSHNYGHWLVDDLPRAKAITALRKLAEGRTLRIWITSYTGAMNRVRIESITLLCQREFNGLGGIEIGLLESSQSYHFDVLHYVTPCSYHPMLKSPDALRFVASVISEDDSQISDIAEGGTDSSKIFVVRRGSQRRALVNTEEIEHILEGKGFVCIDPDGLGFLEQARIFAKAKLVVGCMGAAMANCVFAPSGIVTIYLSPEGWVEPFYWDLAVMLGHSYHACFGVPTNNAGPAHESPYHIDPADLMQILGPILDSYS